MPLPVTLRLASISFLIGLSLALLLAAGCDQHPRLRVLESGWSIWCNIWSIAIPTFCVGVIPASWSPLDLAGLAAGAGRMVMAFVILGIDNAGQIVKPLREELKEAVSMPGMCAPHGPRGWRRGGSPWRMCCRWPHPSCWRSPA